MWQPSSVEDIRAWLAGSYVPNPTAQEHRQQLVARLRRAREDGTVPLRRLVPLDHPSQRAHRG